MRRLISFVLVGLLGWSLTFGFSAPPAQAEDGLTIVERALLGSRLPYQPEVVAPESRRSYLPVLVRPGEDLPSLADLDASAARIPFHPRTIEPSWPRNWELVSLEEALEDIRRASSEASPTENVGSDSVDETS